MHTGVVQQDKELASLADLEDGEDFPRFVKNYGLFVSNVLGQHADINTEKKVFPALRSALLDLHANVVHWDGSFVQLAREFVVFEACLDHYSVLLLDKSLRKRYLILKKKFAAKLALEIAQNSDSALVPPLVAALVLSQWDTARLWSHFASVRITLLKARLSRDTAAAARYMYELVLGASLFSNGSLLHALLRGPLDLQFEHLLTARNPGFSRIPAISQILQVPPKYSRADYAKQFAELFEERFSEWKNNLCTIYLEALEKQVQLRKVPLEELVSNMAGLVSSSRLFYTQKSSKLGNYDLFSEVLSIWKKRVAFLLAEKVKEADQIRQLYSQCLSESSKAGFLLRTPPFDSTNVNDYISNIAGAAALGLGSFDSSDSGKVVRLLLNFFELLHRALDVLSTEFPEKMGQIALFGMPDDAELDTSNPESIDTFTKDVVSLLEAVRKDLISSNLDELLSQELTDFIQIATQASEKSARSAIGITNVVRKSILSSKLAGVLGNGSREKIKSLCDDVLKWLFFVVLDHSFDPSRFIKAIFGIRTPDSDFRGLGWLPEQHGSFRKDVAIFWNTKQPWIWENVELGDMSSEKQLWEDELPTMPSTAVLSEVYQTCSRVTLDAGPGIFSLKAFSKMKQRVMEHVLQSVSEIMDSIESDRLEEDQWKMVASNVVYVMHYISKESGVGAELFEKLKERGVNEADQKVLRRRMGEVFEGHKGVYLPWS